MAQYILQDCVFYLAEFDLTGDHNRLAMDYGAAELDTTVFGQSTRTRKAGLERASLEHAGLVDMADDDVDEVLFTRIAGSDKALTVGPVDGLAGSRALIAEAGVFSYAPGGQVGELAAFTAKTSTKSRLVAGQFLHAKAARTSTSTTSALQVGSVASGKKLYAALHVFAVSGTSPTLSVIVQSDNAEGFPSSANQITFTTATAVTSQWATPVAGAITDNWWRISYTIGGTNPSFTFAVAIGIR